MSDGGTIQPVRVTWEEGDDLILTTKDGTRIVARNLVVSVAWLPDDVACTFPEGMPLPNLFLKVRSCSGVLTPIRFTEVDDE